MKKVLAFLRKALLVLSIGTLVVLVIATALLHALADVTWWATLMAFGPRWVCLVPLGALLPAILIFTAWRALAVWCVAAAVATFGFLDVVVPLATLIQLDAPDDVPLTVMTFNVLDQRRVEGALPQLLVDERIDLVAVEEWNPSRNLKETLPGWKIAMVSGIGLASRYPVRLVEWFEYRDFLLGNDGAMARFDVTLKEGHVVHVYVVHFETPRDGLDEIMGSIRTGRAAMDRNATSRSIESATARRYIDAVGGQFIVLGDFNLPVESRIYRRSWSDLKNAFSDGGWGLGHTKHTRRICVRIDHILCSKGCDVSSAHVGKDLGSDHLPVIARLRFHPASAPVPTE